jgi:protein SCO1
MFCWRIFVVTIRLSLDFAHGKAFPSSGLIRVLVALLFLVHGSSLPSRTPGVTQGAPEGSTLRIHVPDLELTQPDGQLIRLYSGILQGRKAVLINTFFTNCGTICPLVGVRMDRLQQSLGPCNSNEYILVSISVDPATDTPERLQEWGKRFHAGRCWVLLTGAKPQVDAVLKGLHLFTPDRNSHTPSALIGGGDLEQWRLVNVLASPDTLLKMVRLQMSSSVTKEGRTR